MKDKVVIVTGATNGIGEVAALELARMGATVVLISRSQSRLDESVKRIRTETNNPNVSSIQADLSSIAEIRKAANQFVAKHSRLDVLMNNAGAVFDKREESVDGIEMTLALNHLNYFLLTDLLLDTLKATAESYGEARIINVSSEAHEAGRIKLDDIQHKKSYMSWVVYGDSKLMNILFSFELARRLEGTKVTVNALHPGFVNTGFGKNNEGFFKFAMNFVQMLFGSSPKKGAETMIYLASSPELKGISGQYWVKKASKEPIKAARDEKLQTELWTLTEDLIRSVSKG